MRLNRTKCENHTTKFLAHKRCLLFICFPLFTHLQKGGNKTYLSVGLNEIIPGKGSALLVFSLCPLPGTPKPPHPQSKAVSRERDSQHIRRL